MLLKTTMSNHQQRFEMRGTTITIWFVDHSKLLRTTYSLQAELCDAREEPEQLDLGVNAGTQVFQMDGHDSQITPLTTPGTQEQPEEGLTAADVSRQLGWGMLRIKLCEALGHNSDALCL
eukprot:4531536-Amphidinium_carterae.1